MLRLSKFPRIRKNVSNQITIKRFFGLTTDGSGNTGPTFGTGVYNMIYQDAESEQKIGEFVTFFLIFSIPFLFTHSLSPSLSLSFKMVSPV